MPSSVQYRSKLRQLPAAISAGVVAALNRTAEEAQHRMRQQLYLDFTIRSSASGKFLERMVKIRNDERATATRHWATVRIEGPQWTGGRGGGLEWRNNAKTMLFRHERGGVQFAKSQAPFFVPTRDLGRPGGAPIPRSMYPSALGLAPRRAISGAVKEGKAKGKRHTFLIPGVGVFERTGSGRRDIQLLWAFMPAITLKPKLKFHETVGRVVRERLPANLVGMLAARIEQTPLTTLQLADLEWRAGPGEARVFPGPAPLLGPWASRDAALAVLNRAARRIP